MSRTRKHLTKLKNTIKPAEFKKTMKKHSAKKHKMFIYRVGTIDICYIVRNYKSCIRKRIIYGGERGKPQLNSDGFRKNMEKLYEESIAYIEKNKESVKKDMIQIWSSKYNEERLETIYNKILPYLRNTDNKTKTIDEMLKIYENYDNVTNETFKVAAKYDKIFTALDKSVKSIHDGDPSKLNTLGRELIIQLIAPVIYANTIDELKQAINIYRSKGFISDDKADQILRSFDKQVTTTGKLTSKVANLTDKAVNGMMSGAVKLGEWISPVVTIVNKPPPKKENNTSIKMMFFPSTHLQYAKGSAIPSKARKYSDFMVLIDNQYADMGQFFSKMINPVDDLIANVMNGCTDMMCKTGNVTPFPFKIKTMNVTETV